MKMEVAIATRIASTGLQGALGSVHAVGTCLLDPSITPVWNRTKPSKVPIHKRTELNLTDELLKKERTLSLLP